MEPGHGEDRPHVPPPSLWPVGFAIGIACILVGLVVNPTVIIPIGVLIAAIFAFLWIRDASAEYRHVPEVEPETRAVAEPAPALRADEGGAAMPAPAPGERFPRSKFLEFSTLGLGGAIGGIVTLPAVGFAVLPAFTREERREVDLGPIENFPEGQFVIATFLENPELGEVSRRTAYVRNNGVANGQPSFTVISNRCVHLGCPTQVAGVPNEDDATEIESDGEVRVRLTPTIGGAGFNCPCHGGAYNPEGNRTAGPPVRALDRYAFKIVDGRLVLLETYSVSHVDGEGADARIRRYELAGPGIHIDGPEAWLYPFEAEDF
ncbi:MAG: Rieske 2Fe-2S domain-containing protein [Actinomycetota bacterium]|nr:Rieske 2Fe-2S domain-containing protein [Actinomycetota bacterium]